METVQRNASKRKAAATNKSESAVIDVPSDESKVNEFIAANRSRITEFMNQNFEGINAKDIEDVARETAECIVYERTPKVGGVWGSDTSIIEDAIKHVRGPSVATVDPEEPLVDAQAADADAANDPETDDVGADVEKAGPEVEEPQSDEIGEGAAQQADAAPVEIAKPETQSNSRTQETKPESKKAASTKKPMARAKPTSKAKTSAPKKQAKAKVKADDKKKVVKAQTNSKKETKARTEPVSVESLKTLKGREQWIAAAKILKSKKKIWIQAQDIPDVVGHLFDVSNGKAKLNEKGFEGKGEKSYRKNRMLAIKEAIEGIIKQAAK